MTDFLIIILSCLALYSATLGWIKFLCYRRNLERRTVAHHYGLFPVSIFLISYSVCLLTLFSFTTLEDQGEICLLFGISAGVLSIFTLRPSINPRKWLERIVKALLFCCSGVAIIVTLSIGIILFFQTCRFFQQIPFSNFFLGTEWSPTSAIIGARPSFGSLPLFSGTLLITSIGLALAIPFGIISSIYITMIAPKRARKIITSIFEVAAGVPTVVYGFLAMTTVSPWIKKLIEGHGYTVSSENALGAGLVLGVMILPYMSSLCQDLFKSVPQALKDASYALGATTTETIFKVVLPASFPGVMSAALLSLSRAIGETMLVVMALSLTPQLTANPFEAVTTVTVQMVSLLTGDQSFDSPGPLAAFALGFVLFLITLILNLGAFQMVRRVRRQFGND